MGAVRRGVAPGKGLHVEPAWRILCSSFLVTTCFLIKDYTIYYPKGDYIGAAR